MVLERLYKIHEVLGSKPLARIFGATRKELLLEIT